MICQEDVIKKDQGALNEKRIIEQSCKEGSRTTEDLGKRLQSGCSDRIPERGRY